MRRFSLIIFLIFIAVSAEGCMSRYYQLAAHNPLLPPLQKRVIESKELEGSFNDAYKATITVLLDLGYTIKTSDYQSGLIYAESERVPVWGQWSNSYMATVYFEEFREGKVRVRMSLYKQWSTPFGQSVLMNALDKPKFPNSQPGFVDDPKVYQKLYAEIQKEMFRRSQ